MGGGCLSSVPLPPVLSNVWPGMRSVTRRVSKDAKAYRTIPVDACSEAILACVSVCIAFAADLGVQLNKGARAGKGGGGGVAVI